MKIRIASLAAGLLLLAGASPLLQAHHSFAAEFDAADKVKLTGTVTKLQWRNPHTYFFVDITDEKGVVHNWAFELGSPNVLMRRGWTNESLKAGDTVTVEGARARDGSYKANANSVVLASGKRLFNGTAAEETPTP
jgi:DNA/RNA endonuclease YhcR with UshA esterase domain